MATTPNFDSCFDCRDKSRRGTCRRDCTRLYGAQFYDAPESRPKGVDVVDSAATVDLAGDVIEADLVLGDDDLETEWFGVPLPPPLPQRKVCASQQMRTAGEKESRQSPFAVQLLERLTVAARYAQLQGETDA
jgi:hypothetical protein